MILAKTESNYEGRIQQNLSAMICINTYMEVGKCLKQEISMSNMVVKISTMGLVENSYVYL